MVSVRNGGLSLVKVSGKLATGVALLMLAACGGGAASSSSPASGSGTNAGVSVAQSAATAAEQPATSLGITTQLTSKAPTGKTFVFLQCEIPQCAIIGQAIQAATQAIGWTYKSLAYQQANPATLVSAMNLALAYHPTAVGLTGLPEVVWQSEVAPYQAAGVAIVPFAVAPVTVTGPVITDINGAADNTHYGEMLANWAIADSNGQAHVLFVDVPTIAILEYIYQGFKATFDKNCPSCSITVLNQTVPDAVGGQLTTATVSALQRDSSLNYAVTVNGPFFDGLPSALSAAGLSGKVKIAGQGGDPVDLTGVQQGTMHAFTALAATIGGWMMVDATLRHLEGMTIPTDDGGLPTQLLIKGGNWTPSASYDVPSNYADLFKKLWQVG